MEGILQDCYCKNVITQLEGTFQCSACKRRFHPECLRDPVVTPLAADAFYDFTCYQCAPDNTEKYSRAKMSWQDALVLVVYNLQLTGGGKQGYFHWREHICAYLRRNWNLVFKNHRKLRPSMHGTVAGNMSNGGPRNFVSGTAELGMSGWWKLASMKPPVYRVDPPAKAQRRPKRTQYDQMLMVDEALDSKRPRRSNKCFSLMAASELKARRSTTTESTGRRSGTMAAMTQSLQRSQNEPTSTATDTHLPSTSSDIANSGTVVTTGGVDEASSHSRMLESELPGMRSPEQVVVVVKRRGEAEAASFDFETEDSFVADGDGEGYVMERYGVEGNLPDGGGVQQEIKEDGGLQNQGGCLLRNSEDESDDEECPEFDMSTMAFDPTFNADAPCHSPDMVDLVLSMPDSAEAPASFKTHEDDMVQPAVKAENLYGYSPQENSHSETAGKHLPQTSTKLHDFSVDSEGPSEEEEAEVKEEEEVEEEEEDEVEEEEEVEEERDVKPNPCLTVLSARAQTRRNRRLKRRLQREEERKAAEAMPELNVPCLRQMTPYDEKQMQRRLEEMKHLQPKSTDENGRPLEHWETKELCQQRNLMRRKLLLRKAQQEHGQSVFDINQVMARIAEKYGGWKPQNKEEKVSVEGQGRASNSCHPHTFSCTLLDRFTRRDRKSNMDVQHTSFHTRLVGFEDHELRPITSPYSMRVLKPFIWRDKEQVPLKVKLMQEIVSYPHRNDPSWTCPKPASIDYCYVRPQHIPSVNALCSAFFWPGIDLSECLQYPDFSCVAMYRRLVVGFAFLVPDVKPNEAYISFLFTRPGWRGAGIATFMIYHLCQTCMGKDITLHVSATNPAMMLYQKFGFKSEELCLNFYDKYFPVDSKECKHAFFMRLR